MSRENFYEAVTASLYKGSLPSWQRDPLDLILNEGIARERSLYDVAYVMATAHHETGRFQFMEERDEGGSRPYGEPIWLSSKKKVTYHGRGFVQLTWLFNYARMSQIVGFDLVEHPEKVKDHDTAAKIIWEGMIRGTFTGKNLADYISESKRDYVGARKIVNGSDKDEMIAEYAIEFERCLMLIGEEPDTCPDCGLLYSEVRFP